MPGAPNRPPEPSAPPTEAAPTNVESPERRALRRLAPSRIALLLDVWRGAPSPELLQPFARAEASFAHGEYREAGEALDQLSVRFAEPRWPTIPEPFRELRVAIPAPQPPQWDPDFAVSAEEKEARRDRRTATTQLALARASVRWAAARQLDLGPAPAGLDDAGAAFEAGGAPAALYAVIDPIWMAVRERVPVPKAPAPKSAPTPPPTPPPPDPAERAAGR